MAKPLADIRDLGDEIANLNEESWRSWASISLPEELVLLRLES